MPSASPNGWSHATRLLLARAWLIFGAAGCAGSPHANRVLRANAALDSSDCYVRAVSRRVRCVSLRVPLDWDAPSAESITVAAVIVPALNAARREPLFVLPGGPGQGASGYGALVTTAFAEINRRRDLVLVDPRGTGRSTPYDCAVPDGGQLGTDSASRVRFGEECAARAPGPPGHFTAMEVTADIERLRVALGLERIVLWGGSWGTRLVQFYAAAHPSVVSAVILDAAVPVDTPLIRVAPGLANRAWNDLRIRCRHDSGCANAFDTSLTSFEQWIADYGAPRQFEIVDPRTGRVERRAVSRDDILESVRGALYQPSQAAMLPLALRELQHGNAAPLFALAFETAGWSVSTQQLGALLAIMCSEETPFVRTSDLRLDGRERLFDDAYPRVFENYCEHWPPRALPRAMLDMRTVAVPALVLSGSADPVSPPSQGARAAAHFTPSAHLVIPHGGHISSRTSCIPSLMADFLDRPTRQVPTGCLAELPALPFALSPLGPVENHD